MREGIYLWEEGGLSRDFSGMGFIFGIGESASCGGFVFCYGRVESVYARNYVYF